MPSSRYWLPRLRGQDDDSVLKVHGASLAVGDTAVVEHLKQDVEYIGMRLFNLIEQHDSSRACGVPPRSAGRPHRIRHIRAALRSDGRRSISPCTRSYRYEPCCARRRTGSLQESLQALSCRHRWDPRTGSEPIRLVGVGDACTGAEDSLA